MPDQISGASETMDCRGSFSWLKNFRRPAINYDFPADTAETMVQLALSVIILNNLKEKSFSRD